MSPHRSQEGGSAAAPHGLVGSFARRPFQLMFWGLFGVPAVQGEARCWAVEVHDG